jgi:hypothetical protein
MFIVTPNGVIIDAQEYARIITRLAFKVLKSSIEDKDIQRLLPFQTSLELGNHVHIVNESAYAVETKYHVITDGDTLCARGGRPRGTVTGTAPTCPGCLAKAQGIVVNHLLDQAAGDFLAVAYKLQEVAEGN